jgi:hypothetical protein
MRSSEAESRARNSRHAASLIPFALMLDMPYRIAGCVILTLKEIKEEPEACKLFGIGHRWPYSVCHEMCVMRWAATES